jgi:uncharacterized protein
MTAPPDIRFVVDHMLVKLGKYLRILGYDAAWEPGLRTHELICRANADARIFVTRNTRLAGQYPAPDRLIAIASTDPVLQLGEVAAQVALDRSRLLFSRCIRCNVLLESVSRKEEIRERVHPNVFARFARFYRCPSCGTVFWKGSHVRNTCRKLGLACPDEANVEGAEDARTV